MQKVFSMVLVAVFFVFLLTGCAMFGNSDYDKHTQARVKFKESDDKRIEKQTEAISNLANKPAASAEAEAYKNALATLTISLLKNQEYGERAPMTAIEGVVEVAKIAVPIGINAAGNVALAKEVGQVAGNVDIGQGATVNDSLNKPSATNVGSSNVATVQPKEVRPEIVEPSYPPVQ